MAGRSDIEAGRAFVRLFLKNDLTKALTDALRNAGRSLKAAGDAMQSWGTKGMVAGAALAAPLTAAVVAGARFEDTLLDIRGSTGATVDDMAKIEAAALGTRAGPASAAESFLEMLKAGSSLESVLGGAGKTAVEFGKVARMAAGQAAVVLADGMKVFDEAADTVANTISAAADASSTDITGMAQAFSQASAVAKLANQGILDTSAALAILANNGIKGGDAGTSLKAMLLALTAPSEIASKKLTELGMSTNDFRDSAGKMLPMAQIIGMVNQKLGGLGQAAKDEALKKIFGTDAIRAAAILGKAGPAGIDAMKKSMSEALPVGEKYKIFMSGLTGLYEDAKAGAERLAIVVSKALAPSLQMAGKWIGTATTWLTKFIEKNKQIVVWAAYAAGGLLAGGAALMGLGIVFSTAGSALTGLASVVGFLLSPVALLTGALVAGGVAWVRYTDSGKAALTSFKAAFEPLAGTVTESIRGIVAALGQGDFAAAGAIAAAGFRVAILEGIEGIGALLPAALQPVTDVMRKIGGLMVDGKWGEIGKLALGGLTEAFTWATETIKANWDTWLQAMSDKLYEVIGKVWGWWNEKVQDMTTKVILPSLGFKDEKQLNEKEKQETLKKRDFLKGQVGQRENILAARDSGKGFAGYGPKDFAIVEADLKRMRGELAAAESRLKWLTGTGIGGAENAPIESRIAEREPPKADTSVADREAARLRQQAAADAAAKRFADLFGISSTPEETAGNDAAAAARIKAEKDKLKALTDAVQTAGYAADFAAAMEGGIEATARPPGAVATGVPGATGEPGEQGEVPPPITEAAAKDNRFAGLTTYSAAAAQAIGFGGTGGGGGPAERTAKGVDKLIANVEKQLAAINEGNVTAEKLISSFELLKAQFSYG